MKKGILWGVLALVLLLSACGSREKPQVLSDEAREAVLAYSEEKTDTLLTGLSEGDYAAFSRDFTERMKTAMSEANFPDLQLQIIGKIGAYLSREVRSVEQSGEFIAVIYTAKFELDDPVIVRVVFEAAEPHSVTGLWFDSARLRRK